jgi:hypothetical protein
MVFYGVATWVLRGYTKTCNFIFDKTRLHVSPQQQAASSDLEARPTKAKPPPTKALKPAAPNLAAQPTKHRGACSPCLKHVDLRLRRRLAEGRRLETRRAQIYTCACLFIRLLALSAVCGCA